MLHHDLKPSNIMLARHPIEGEVAKVLDFGTASLLSRYGGSQTGIAGTPLYIAPELTRREVATPASDLYSLGIVAFELVTGHPPFRGETAVETMMMHQSKELPPLPDEVALSPLGEFINWATAKERSVRLADVTSAKLTLTGERRVAFARFQLRSGL